MQKLLDGDYLRVMRLHENLHNLSDVPHRHDHFELLYITEGEGKHYINFKEFELKPGRVYFLHPGQVHLINQFQRKGWLVMFGAELFMQFLDIHRHEHETGLLDSYTPYPFIDLDERASVTFQLLIDQTQTELSLSKPHAGLQLHYAALLLLIVNRLHLTQHPKNAVTAKFSADFYQLKQLIEEHFKHHHQAEYYAGEIKADIKKLNRICREHTGFTVAGLLKERLLTEAKILLQTTGISVKEISYQLGFNDPAFFGRFFKQHTGYTPAGFRDMRMI